MRVLIVAAYASVRAGLHALLARAADEVEIEVVGEANSSGEVEASWPSSRPDLLLLDAGADAVDDALLLELATARGAAVVWLGEGGDVTRLADSGVHAWACLSKDAGASELQAAIRAVEAGLVVLDRGFLQQEAPTLAADSSDEVLLTPREREVLQLMAQGLPNKQIATKLNISGNTAKFHVASILGKMSASSRTEAVTQGARRGLVML